MVKYEIKRGVPILPDGRGRPSKYPFAQMLAGDHFEAAGDQRRISSAARGYGKLHNMKFATRRLPNGNVGVWRIA